MEIAEVRDKFFASAILYQPMDIFEPLDRGKTLKSFLDSCEQIMAKHNSRNEIYYWLGRLPQTTKAAFYGSVLYGVKTPNDVDIAVFPPSTPHMQAPRFTHRHELEDTAGLFVANGLLFPTQPIDEAVEIVETGRRAILNNEFFNGGIGELITHAVYKITLAKTEFTPEEIDRVGRIKFALEHQWTDFSNMSSHVYSPHEINEKIRTQMRDLKDDEIRILTTVAMRRIRIREEKQAEFSDRFAKELKEKKNFRRFY